MIEKSRLEELIKKNATIYCLGGGKYKLTEDDFVSRIEGEDALMSFDNLGFYENVDYLKNFFETEKQAEWALKYHATRIEELDLPMWEEIKDIKNNKTIVSFYAKDKETDTVYMYMYAKHLIVETKYKEFLNTEFTEENYITACDLCLKLFKGENND